MCITILNLQTFYRQIYFYKQTSRWILKVNTGNTIKCNNNKPWLKIYILSVNEMFVFHFWPSRFQNLCLNSTGILVRFISGTVGNATQLSKLLSKYYCGLLTLNFTHKPIDFGSGLCKCQFIIYIILLLKITCRNNQNYLCEKLATPLLLVTNATGCTTLLGMRNMLLIAQNFRSTFNQLAKITKK